MTDPSAKNQDLGVAVLLRSDNFTPLSRTPWAGDGIIRRVKYRLFPERLGDRVGESWEFSCDPLFESETLDGVKLSELFKQYPQQILGPELTQTLPENERCNLLVKLIHASDALSLQLHPRDDDPDLKANECGKPESWYVIHADDGAGIYLGFNQVLNREEFAKVLSSDGAKAQGLLQFVPVKAGDYFEIVPGVPHAIGPGVLVLEPQRSIFGKSGKTFRMWDWGRKYNRDGTSDPVNGNARELHVHESLKILDLAQVVGDRFVEKCRRPFTTKRWVNGCAAKVFPKNEFCQLAIFSAAEINTRIHLALNKGFAFVMTLSGEFKITPSRYPDQISHLRIGQSALIPFDAKSLEITSTEKSSELVIIVPSEGEWSAESI